MVTTKAEVDGSRAKIIVDSPERPAFVGAMFGYLVDFLAAIVGLLSAAALRPASSPVGPRSHHVPSLKHVVGSAFEVRPQHVG